ncbi:conserved hypothetical protein [Aspergillus terreus NIH2624]|uniref:Asparaginase n=1 Tax=Aspergillus terreus (strain NIH 2624 / FGSC A1156) TaxID=341663 RepID=Q0CW20_ASPTN|nr:uncharacterized protein ATEG_02114 [Aspergillus terreus NIH2624]EAU37076.1 conserved hypothetical protein [Aspergillus terreus NIH2624]
MSRQKGNDIAAIFVHAGAGFHSHNNEKAHLETCENAARAAMALLKAGASAVEAVEMAIIVLEDAEITNAGYGSNMTLDGAVECDATIVNHLGRSGAVGAVAQVKNPISLARLTLDASSKPLSLQRVPPNFLVGQGATDFAYEHGLVVLPHDGLIAPAAKERWHRWRLELEEAEFKERQQDPNSFSDVVCAGNPNPILTSPLPYNAMPSFVTARDGECSDGIPVPQHVSANANDTEAHATVSMDSESRAHISSDTHRNVDPEDLLSEFEMDQISDTVGAIAIDSVGNIAAGSSSGGIGMKHRGRIGPAALVGVGTTVIPVDPNDPEKTCVATVTSGTGEHIATTMAASVCSTRVYYCQKKCEDGTFEEATEDDAMRTMIESEFMGHPGVKDSHCHGAIGIMSVKKTIDGVFLFFGHNTDSFVSTISITKPQLLTDKKPVSVMSRSNGNGSIAQGGRAYRYRRFNLRGTAS